MQVHSSSKRSKSLALAFSLPVFSMLMVMIIGGYKPFGNLSMLYSDMYHQYYPFWVEFRDALRSGDSLLYTWSVGLGMDYLSLISYYLASPLNLLGIFVPASLTLEFYSLLVPIKLGLAGLFFAIFLHKTFDKDDLSISFFGAMYGLCAWALAYQWNVMWLDTFALLPLLALGTIQLLKDRKFILYTLTLFLSVFANYYIGFFSCIFVLLLFFCYEICRWKGWKRFVQDFVRIGFFTVLAIGMTAILTLPAFMGLQNTQSSVNSFPKGFHLNIASENTFAGLLDAMRQVAGNTMGGLEPSFKEGLPNLYCGVGSMLLAFLFCTCKDIKLRDKICSVLLLIFFMLSCIIRQLDYIWHGFHFTNMIPYRFTFLFSFVILYMAYRAYLQIHSFRLWQIICGGVLCLGLILCSDSRSDWVYLGYNLGFLVLYLLLFVVMVCKKTDTQGSAPDAAAAPSEVSSDSSQPAVRKSAHAIANFAKNPHALFSICLACIVVLEIAMNVLNFGLRFPATGVSNYPSGTQDTKAVIEFMHEKEHNTPFYRAEMTHSQTLNDGALNGYNGITTFTSSANVKVTEFMESLGYGAKNTYNRYCYEESSPIANLFLGIKYMIERNGNTADNSYFNLAHSSGNVYLLENNAYLPLGFLTRPELADFRFRNVDHFGLQNELFRVSTGVTEDVWHLIQKLTVEGENVDITSQQGYVCNYENAASGSSVTYRFTAERNGFACLDFDVTDRNSFHVFHNDVELYSDSLSLPQMVAVCDVAAGDVITVRLNCDSGEEGRMTVKAGIVDGSVFRTGHEILSASTLDITSFSSTQINGSIRCQQDGLLYTSIPQDGNWRVYVDGDLVEHQLVGNAMIGVMLKQGSHDIRFEYHNTAFSYGWKISGICVLLFVICILILPNYRKGKFVK